MSDNLETGDPVLNQLIAKYIAKAYSSEDPMAELFKLMSQLQVSMSTVYEVLDRFDQVRGYKEIEAEQHLYNTLWPLKGAIDSAFGTYESEKTNLNKGNEY